MLKQRVTILFLLLMVSLGASLSSLARQPYEVLLQGFNWESYKERGQWYGVLESRSQDIATTGFTAIWLPPVSYSYDGGGLYPHSRGYLPIEYYNLNSAYGNEDSLRRTVAAFKGLHVKPIADLVLNHRKESYWKDGKPIFQEPSWDLNAFTGGPGMLGQGNPDSGDRITYGFDIDHTNQEVFAYLVNWIKWLKESVGFEGWRYDFTRGYDPRFVGMINAMTQPKFSVGEYWVNMNNNCPEGLCYNQDSHRQAAMRWIDATWKTVKLPSQAASTAFDFTTKGILQQSIWSNEFWRLRDPTGRASGMIGWWPAQSVTFVDNHDTGSTQNHWPFGSPDQVMQGYAYILTHPGTPCVFWDHFYNWGLYGKIKLLMGIRKQFGINSESQLQILRAENGLYAALIDGKVAMKIGPSPWDPGDGFALVDSGVSYAIWVRR